MQTGDMLDRLPVLSTSRSWVSRYVGLPDLCEKGTYARMVLACQDFCEPGYFDFNPKTWVLPDQYEELRSFLVKKNRQRTLIIKPEDGSQGDGIFLVQGLKDLVRKIGGVQQGPQQTWTSSKAYVVQRYIDKPLLLNGLKFDLRMYICLIGGSLNTPPKVFVCREGLARFCTEIYEEPRNGNLHKPMGHLTNYAVNKRSEKFEHSAETLNMLSDLASVASKRPLSTVLRQIKAEHPDFDVEAFFESIAAVAVRTVALMAPALSCYYRQHAADRCHEEMRSFQILGLDVMLDREFHPFLLEVNNAPSFCIDEAFQLEPGEPGSEQRAGIPGRPREKDKVCLCADMQQPHRHQTSLVDLVVKTTVMSGAFQLLAQIQEDIREPEVDCYISVDVALEPIYGFLKAVEDIFQRNGGAQKAFSSSGMRRIFAPLFDGSFDRGLEKHDLDTMSHRYKVTKFRSTDSWAKPDSLRLFDFVDLLRQIGARACPGADPLDAVQAILAKLV
jgi:hypothetical protein